MGQSYQTGNTVIPPAGAAPTQAFQTPDLSKVDLTKVLAGDWLGSGVTSLATLATAFALAVVGLLIMQPDNISVHEFLAVATIIAAAAFGGDVSVSADGHTAVSAGYYPLTITFLALGVGTLLLRRQLARYDSLAGAIGHVVRSAIILAVGLMILTLAMRTGVKVPYTFAAVGIGDLNGVGVFFSSNRDFAIQTVGVVFLALLWIGLIGGWLVTGRREWMHPKVTMVRDWLVAPLQGFAIILAGTVVLGVVGAVILFLTKDGTHNPTSVVLWLFSLPNIGMVALGLGSGTPLLQKSDGATKATSESTKHYLAFYADHLTSWMWILPVGTAVVLVLSALFVARRSTPQALPANLLRWVGVTTVLLPVLAHFGAYRMHYRFGKGGNRYVHVYAGIDPWILLGLGLAWTFGIAVIFAAIGRARSSATTAPYAADYLQQPYAAGNQQHPYLSGYPQQPFSSGYQQQPYPGGYPQQAMGYPQPTGSPTGAGAAPQTPATPPGGPAGAPSTEAADPLDPGTPDEDHQGPHNR